MRTNSFDQQSPERVLKQAEEFKETFNEFLTLPNSPRKTMHVSKVVDYELDQIKYSITRAQYQNDLFRKLQQNDQELRKKISKSLLLRDNKADKSIAKIQNQSHKKSELYSKRVNEVHKRYLEQEHKKFEKSKQGALKLRKQIKEFYQKQEQRKKLSQQNQVKVATCYQNALEKIHKIQKESEDFSQKAQIELNNSFIRNNPQKKNQHLRLRISSLDFKKNESIYLNSQLILKQKEEKHIQHLAKNQTCSLKAFEKKIDDNEKTKKRIHEKIKQNTERWVQQKKRIDEANEQVPQKCTSRIQRSLQTKYRHTFSTFKDSFSKWRMTGEFNRSKIKDEVDKRKDEIIGMHEDITLKNRSMKQIDDKMMSIRHRVRKVSNAYL